MTEDIIVDETAKFIRSSEANLKLALQVERAMRSMREHFVKAALEAVVKRFRRREWTVDRSKLQDVMAEYVYLSLSSSAWMTDQDGAYIGLGSDKADWGKVWIGLWFTAKSSQEVRSIKEKVESLIGSEFRFHASTGYAGAYKYPDGELGDWSGERFLTRILEDGPDQIASEISAELKVLDKFLKKPTR